MEEKKNIFIEKAKKVHGDKYDYSQINYVNSHTKMKIICPIHGEFWQNADHHLQGCGCPYCAGKVKLTREEFIKRSILVHGAKYDYSKVEYVNNSTRVCIICPIHGEFWQTPLKHLIGRGCQKCGAEECHKNRLLTTENFIEKARKVHGNKYDYSKVEYKHNAKKVCIICPIHGEFWQTPNNHLHGDRCPKCKMSKLEELVSIFLTKNNIEYVYQKHSKWLGKQSLDFFLPKYNIALECQGMQHFVAVSFHKNGDANKNLQENVLRDEKKFLKCSENNVKIIYVTDKMIENTKSMIYNENNCYTKYELPKILNELNDDTKRIEV